MRPLGRTHPMTTRSISREIQERAEEAERAELLVDVMRMVVTAVDSEHGQIVTVILNSSIDPNRTPLDNRVIILTSSISLPIGIIPE